MSLWTSWWNGIHLEVLCRSVTFRKIFCCFRLNQKNERSNQNKGLYFIQHLLININKKIFKKIAWIIFNFSEDSKYGCNFFGAGDGALVKGGFYSESAIRFLDPQISKSPKQNIPKSYPALEIQISRQKQ